MKSQPSEPGNLYLAQWVVAYMMNTIGSTAGFLHDGDISEMTNHVETLVIGPYGII
jgi:hypothetical protein